VCGAASRDCWKKLEQLRALRLKARDVFSLLGGDAAALVRMRGEQPFLRSTRSRLEAVGDELGRVRGELEVALRHRQDAERLWHSAELDRDREVADKARLYEMIGTLEGELDRERREGARKVAAAVDDLRAAEAALAQQRARANAEIGAEHARMAAHFEEDRAAQLQAHERRTAELRARIESEEARLQEQKKRLIEKFNAQMAATRAILQAVQGGPVDQWSAWEQVRQALLMRGALEAVVHGPTVVNQRASVVLANQLRQRLMPAAGVDCIHGLSLTHERM
jgi:hypothetical protein